MSLVALNKKYSWLKVISWCSAAGLFLNTRITLFPEASHFPWCVSLISLNCFIKNQETFWCQLPFWEICGVPDYRGLSQEIVVSSSFRPWPFKFSYSAEDQNCWRIRPAWDLSLLLCPAQDAFPNFKKAQIWAMELFRVLVMVMVKVLILRIGECFSAFFLARKLKKPKLQL